MKKKVILSYDYELFFGISSGTVQKSIIQPTNQLLDRMEKYNLRGNFFIDYLMVKYIKQQTDGQAQKDIEALENQMIDMVCRGHRIELHLHPHWIDAKYLGNGLWDFTDYSHYSLSSLDNRIVMQMFTEGTDYLNTLARQVDPQYKVCAFRAGGWAIQPFERLKEAFMAAGIKIDSSCSYGISCSQENSFFDFRSMPDKSWFNFNNDVCHECIDGYFIEIPISSFRKNVIIIFVDKMYRLFTHYFDKYSDGSHQRKEHSFLHTSLLNKVFGVRTMLTFSSLSTFALWWALCLGKQRYIYCFIDHPKDVSCATMEGIDYIGSMCESLLYVDLVA